MKRVTDWRARLGRVVEQCRRKPHVYGTQDCGTFVAACVEAMTSVDIAARFRGRYNDAASAVRVLQEDGYKDVVEYLASILEETRPILARVGDVLVYQTPETGYGLGICNGDHALVLHSRGVGVVSRDAAVKAFRIP